MLVKAHSQSRISPQFRSYWPKLLALVTVLLIGVGPLTPVQARSAATRPARVLQSADFIGVGSISWSPDGKQLVFDVTFKNRGDDVIDLFTVNADGTNLRRLTNLHIFNNAPSWSPDGSLIAFYSNRSANGDIYTM